ncbi:hypothetical protein BN1012_Phect348 [Candidatus Phaeomarinobacter ectocarpi]|uniref:N-acetyltransferase domain-containing protein n=1 Tax=Candidatus Phaeomarinibacter ectocarpi TaxID=1458461 RepID=X5MBV4_9HYPH|nr:hypothetical protein [Candidatus Phaeomarinobacter ectocarpi]CDO58562.1 hypothetical protein BN1012_Phect348 [Candidatus Phaeomarinobacter ectocarpi]
MTASHSPAQAEIAEPIAAAKPEIRFCNAHDIAKVEAFIDAHWAKGHVLAHDRTLMDWQHKDAVTDRYTYAVAQRPGVDELDAIIGFISTSQYDPALCQHNTIWFTTWMVSPLIKAGGLGMRLLRFVQQNEPHTLVGTVGNNAAVAPVYKALGYTTGILDRYVIANLSLQTFHLLQGHENISKHPKTSDDITIRMLDEADLSTCGIDALIAHTATPKKTPAYLAARYLHHPRYSYQLLGIEQAGTLRALAVTRLCEAPAADNKTATALRVVDWFGSDNAIGITGEALSAYLTQTGAEYADLYVHGIAADAFKQSSWHKVEPDGPLVVPNYFEPFAASNTDIRFAIRHQDKQTPALRLFKADADQDRPNTLPQQENSAS